jgi:hypothetical protein
MVHLRCGRGLWCLRWRGVYLFHRLACNIVGGWHDGLCSGGKVYIYCMDLPALWSVGAYCRWLVGCITELEAGLVHDN